MKIYTCCFICLQYYFQSSISSCFKSVGLFWYFFIIMLIMLIIFSIFKKYGLFFRADRVHMSLPLLWIFIWRLGGRPLPNNLYSIFQTFSRKKILHLGTRKRILTLASLKKGKEFLSNIGCIFSLYEKDEHLISFDYCLDNVAVLVVRKYSLC